MTSRLGTLLAAFAVGIGATLVAAAPAESAPPPPSGRVKVLKIPEPAPGTIGTSVLVKPRLSVSGRVRSISTTITVRHRDRVVTKRKGSVRLVRHWHPYEYHVTVLARFKVKRYGRWSTDSSRRIQSLMIRPLLKKCATSADARAVQVGNAPRTGDDMDAMVRRLGPLQDLGMVWTLERLHQRATEQGDSATTTEVEGLYGRGYRPEDTLETFEFRRCDAPDRPVVVEVLRRGEDPRAYRVPSDPPIETSSPSA